MYMRHEAGDWSERKVREIVGFGWHASGCDCCEGKHVTSGGGGRGRRTSVKSRVN